MQQESVSLGFQTVESIGDIIEMSTPKERRVRFAVENPDNPTDVQMRQELEVLIAAQQSGTAFILGHSHVKAIQGSSVFKRLAVDFGYNFLRRNCRGPDVVLNVPPASLLEVGMVYVV
ncbi:putative potassium transporter [Helianthus anomalus]